MLLEWADATENRAAPDGADAYGDAAALQFPRRFGAGTRLPYVGMGDDAQEVALYLQRAGADGPDRAAGGGRRLRHVRPAPTWAAVQVGHALRRRPEGLARRLPAAALRRPATTSAAALVPFSVAVWDGAGKERGGNKALAGWKFLRLPGIAADPAYQAELAWGRPSGRPRRPAQGPAALRGHVHRLPPAVGAEKAVPGLAPDLSGIGVIATPGYLRDSILAPSAVIVPNPNPPSTRTARRSPTRAGPGRPTRPTSGTRASADGQEGLHDARLRVDASPATSATIVAYLVTLGREEPPGREEAMKTVALLLAARAGSRRPAGRHRPGRRWR